MFNRFFQSSAVARRADAGNRDGDGNLTASANNIPSTVIQKFGLSPVYSAEDPKIDVVLVHGLNGHPEATWTTSDAPHVFWPSQLLPESLDQLPVRVFVYGYNAQVYSFAGSHPTSDDILHHAQTLITTVVSERGPAAEQRPIIWICHSLGGILVKKMLELSRSITSTDIYDQRSLYVSTYAIIFLGTPHFGSDLAKWGTMAEAMCRTMLPKKLLDTEPGLINTLRTQSETLQNINASFANIQGRFQLAFFHEAVKTDFGGTRGFVVERHSAAPPGIAVFAGIEDTHSGMCKFGSNRSQGYRLVVSNLCKYAAAAPKKIEARWSEEHDWRGLERRARRKELEDPVDPRPETAAAAVAVTTTIAQASRGELLPTETLGMTPPTTALLTQSDTDQAAMVPYCRPEESKLAPAQPQEALFIIPPIYRPNKIFVGMQDELAELDRLVFDGVVHGATYVLLWSLAGSGKTHLVRQFVFTSRDRFACGIFWMRVRSEDDFVMGLWDLARRVGMADLPERRSLRHERIRGKEGEGEAKVQGRVSEEADERFLAQLKAWFETRHGWLLVLDGLAIDTGEELARLQAFLPDGRQNSIIMTSIDKSLAGRSRLRDPIAIKVKPLTKDEALQLLWAELAVTKPNEAQIKKATKLVVSLGQLPLAIHILGKVLRETREPLVKYHTRPYSLEAQVREPFNEIVKRLEALKHIEAINLMELICLYCEEIPVELLQFGIRILNGSEVEFRAQPTGTGTRPPQLNETFRVLLRYALVERNESGNEHDASQRRRASKSVDAIDVLRIHPVIQTFFLERLQIEGRMRHRLHLAVRVYRASFEAAQQRIKGGAGLTSDYSEYERHGKLLMEHVDRNRARAPELEEDRTWLESSLRWIRSELREDTPTSNSSSLEHALNDDPPPPVSVFDRTSSSSSAGFEAEPPPDQLRRVNYLPFDAAKSGMVEPVRVRHGAPVVRPWVPNRRLEQAVEDDRGYQSDLEMTDADTAMMAEPSGNSTLRRSPRSEQGDGREWQLVQRRAHKRSGTDGHGPMHRTIGRTQRGHRGYMKSRAWRYPNTTHVAAQLNRSQPEGSENRGGVRPQVRASLRTRSSEAELQQVQLRHSALPAAPDQRHGPRIPTGLSSRHPPGTVRRAPDPIMTYAGVAAGHPTAPSPRPVIEMRPSRPNSTTRPAPFQTTSDTDQGRFRGRKPGPGYLVDRPSSTYSDGAVELDSERVSASPMYTTHSSPGPQSYVRIPPPPLESSWRHLPSRLKHFSYPPQHYPFTRQSLPPILPMAPYQVYQLPPPRGQANPQPFSDIFEPHPFPTAYPQSSSPTPTLRQHPTPYVLSTRTLPALSNCYTPESHPLSRDHSFTSSNVSYNDFMIANSEPPRSPPLFPSSPGTNSVMSGSPPTNQPRPSRLGPLRRPSTPRLVRTTALDAVGSWALPNPIAPPTMKMSHTDSGPGIIARGTYLQFGEMGGVYFQEEAQQEEDDGGILKEDEENEESGEESPPYPHGENQQRPGEGRSGTAVMPRAGATGDGRDGWRGMWRE